MRVDGRAIRRWAVLGVGGAVLGVVGTGVHRSMPPWGLVLALVTVLVGAVVARAWSGWVGALALAMGVAAAVGVLAQRGPGGDVLVAAEPVGYVWYGGATIVLLVAVLPARWFSDRPIGGSDTSGP